MLNDILKQLLDELEQALIDCHLYTVEMIDPKCLESVQPFAIDTMKFEQWLQFVLLVKFRALLDNGQGLPTAMQITPMAEQVYADCLDDVQPLLKVLHRLDQLYQ